jgi:CubicO group peptidase (beta-lactamase class C family)
LNDTHPGRHSEGLKSLASYGKSVETDSKPQFRAGVNTGANVASALKRAPFLQGVLASLPALDPFFRAGLFFLLLWAPSSTSHPSLVLSTPASAGFPETFPADLDRALQEATDRGATAGAEGLVLVGNKIVYHNAKGFLKKTPNEVPLRKDAVFDLASLTKVVVTTTSVMILVERGKIDLDEPVHTYLPEFTGFGKDAITVRQLLTHSSGLGNMSGVYFLKPGKRGYREFVWRIGLANEPGSERVYSDLGLTIAGWLVERVSGRPLDEFAEKEIFKPLGMKQTFFLPPLSKRWRCAATEKCPWRGRVLQGEVHDENAFAMGGVAGHAGLFSTAKDLALFCRMMLNGGSYDRGRILHPETVREMTRPQPLADYNRQGLGWWIQEEMGQKPGWLRSGKSYGHTGFTGTSLWLDPENDVAAILLMNAIHPNRQDADRTFLRQRFHEIIVEALVSRDR